MLMSVDSSPAESPSVNTGVSTAREQIRPHIAALDGLRFIAAACVLIAHGFHYLVILQDNTQISSYNAPIIALSTVGMTLFFVLSGFVIHYNYAATVSLPGGKWEFFVARFARLYPLFLLIFIIETIDIFKHPDGKTDLIGPLPFFLTFTESWWFWGFGDRVADEAYSNATGLMWSLSTEAFFYLIYPMVAPWLRGLAGGRLLVVGTIVALIAAFLTSTVINHTGHLVAFAQLYTGNPQTAQQFPHWLTFNSPWIRVFEFLLGALAAQYVMSTEFGDRWARISGGAALAVLLSCYLYSNIELMPISGGITTCLAFTFAIVIGASAKSGHGISAALSSRWMVRGGQASYSLYLLHYWVMHDLGHRLADFRSIGVRVVIYLVLMVVSVLVSQISYLGFERPTTRLTRRLLSARRAP